MVSIITMIISTKVRDKQIIRTIDRYFVDDVRLLNLSLIFIKKIKKAIN